MHQYLKLIKDSFSCTPMGADIRNLIKYRPTLKYFAFTSTTLILTSCCDVLVTFYLTTKLRDVHYNQCFEEHACHVLSDPRLYQFYLIQVNKIISSEMGKNVEYSTCIWCTRKSRVVSHATVISRRKFLVGFYKC